MDISATIDSTRLLQEINSIDKNEIPQQRTSSIKSLTRQVLQNIIKRTPIESGAARASWVTALEQLGGTAPVGWQGDSPEAAAINEGTKQGDTIVNDNQHQTEILATSNVEYISFLEYGTSNRTPIRMVRLALADAKNQKLFFD